MKKQRLLYGVLLGLLMLCGCKGEGSRIAGRWVASGGGLEVEFWKDGTCCFSGIDGSWACRALDAETGQRAYIEIRYRDMDGSDQRRYWSGNCLYLNSTAFVRGNSIRMIKTDEFKK